MLSLQSFLRKGVSLGHVGRNYNLKDLNSASLRILSTEGRGVGLGSYVGRIHNLKDLKDLKDLKARTGGILHVVLKRNDSNNDVVPVRGGSVHMTVGMQGT